MKKKSFLLIGYYGFGNRGDDIINSIVAKTLSTIFPTPDIYLITGPKPEKDIYLIPGLTLIKREKNILNSEVFFSLLRSSSIIYTGGSLFTGYNIKSLISYSLPAILARILRKKRYFFSQGLGPFFDFKENLILKIALDNSQIIYLRDKESSEILKKEKIKSQNILVSVDSAYALFKKNRFIARNSGAGAKKIGLNFRTLEKIMENKDEELIKIVELLTVEFGYNLFLFPMSNNDAFYHEELYNKCSEFARSKIKFMDYNSTTNDMIASLSAMDLSIGMRLHFNILSFIAGVPTIGLSYDKKVDALFNNMELTNDCLSIKNIDIQIIKNRIIFNIENRKEVSSHILKKNLQFKNIVKKNLDFLKSEIEKE